MRTRISVFCDQVIEAGWLLALVIVPLFFNVYSNRVFEPDKLALLRSIAVLMAAAWLIRWIEERVAGGDKGGDAQPAPAERFWKIPLVGPTLILAVVYLLATATSVVPRTSLWGSYQRLQGTYTTLSYMVVFMLMVQNLRRQEQLRRVVSTVIITSLPISFYGLLQHYGLDSLPWAGDVVSRVASNMGNAIFVAAYLIMVVPLTLARILHLQAKALEGAGLRWRVGFAAFFWVLLLLQIWAWSSIGFIRGLIAGLLAVAMLVLAGLYLKRPTGRFVLLGCYSLALAAQVVCIFFSESRGPWLGLIAGLFFFSLLYALCRRWRAMVIVSLILPVLVLGTLVVMNLPRSPLARLRSLPYVGRLGSALEIESGTNRVRVLIWEGVVEMLKSNPLRAVIGYGPEAMYVAYNPFYPPELAHIEARNASPDRSHNETWDALVITGFVGFVALAFLFGSLFYYSLSRLGLVQGRAERTLFLALGLGGAFGGVAFARLVDGAWRFAGMGLPLGFLAGVSLYVAVATLRGMGREPASAGLNGWPLLLLIALIAGIVAHFVEIHFGIAIAATRTYFWAYSALIVVLGQGFVSAETARTAETAKERSPQGMPPRGAAPARPERRRKGSKRRLEATRLMPQKPASTLGVMRGSILSMALIVGLILLTAAWDYTVNPTGESDPLAILVTSLTTLAARGRPNEISLGMMWLVLGVFILGTLSGVAEWVESDTEGLGASWWLSSLGLFALVAGGIGGLFALIHAARLGPNMNLENLIYGYYVAVLFIWIALALALFLNRPLVSSKLMGWASIGYLVLVVLCVLFIDNVNIRIVKADVVYKQGLKFDQEGKWDGAIYFYTKALEIAPEEDFYHLFRGRALMERAKIEEDLKKRDAYFSEALAALTRARQLNPLNTDHTANIARLYRTWGELDPDPNGRREKLQRSLEYYAEATKLSPHSAVLFDEWGLVYYILGDLDQAMAKYEQSLKLDQKFLQTYVYMGDVYLARKQWQEAIPVYQKAVALNPDFVQGWSAMGYVYAQLGAWNEAISANMKVLEVAPRDYSTLKNLAILYNQSERPKEALSYAQRALEVAPEQDKPTLESFVQQLRDKIEKED